ncbi:transcriptional regulator, partial [Pseudomonas putida]
PGELLNLQRDMPMVLVDRQLPELNVDLVGLDNAQAIEQALDHLQARGYRDILAVTEPLDGTSSRLERTQAFTASISRRAGMRQQLVEIDGNLHARLDAFLGSNGHGPQAIFTFNGVATLTVTRVLHDAGCNLFQDVGLIALDELDWYPLVGSGITALAQPTERIGVAAFDCLHDRLRGESGAPRRLDFKAELIIRGSTQTRE